METKNATLVVRIGKFIRKHWLLSGISFLTLVFLGSFTFGKDSSSEKIELGNSKVNVYHIKVKFAEAYLIKDEKLILIEAGFPGKADLLEKEIRNLGFKPEDIALTILTHGHGDHAGSAAELQKNYHIPVLGSVFDLDKFQAGQSDLAKSDRHGFLASVIGKTSDLKYTPFTPDVLVRDSSIDLAPYGVNGRVIPVLGGHTPGSLAVVVDNKYLFCGDLVRADMRSKGVPTEHWFQENRKEAKEKLKHIVDANPGLEIVFPGHNGKILLKDIKAYLGS